MKIENIKFKAKRLDNGEWVKGSLIRSTAGINERAYIVDAFSSMSDYSIISVDPSTICQFTGLKDHEGKEVWEGDIIKGSYTSEENTIEWNDHLCCFNTVDKIQGSRYYLEKAINELGWHVIGNKFNKKEIMYEYSNFIS